jgi:N-dimethylarginine dimethylaminohydrolase
VTPRKTPADRRSFRSLAAALTAAGARLEIMPGLAGLPDMVFPANAAVVLDRLALPEAFDQALQRIRLIKGISNSETNLLLSTHKV